MQAPALLMLPGAQCGPSWCTVLGSGTSYVAFECSYVDVPLVLQAIRPDCFEAVHRAAGSATGVRDRCLCARGDGAVHAGGTTTRCARTTCARRHARARSRAVQSLPEALFSVAAVGHRVAAGTVAVTVVFVAALHMYIDNYNSGSSTSNLHSLLRLLFVHLENMFHVKLSQLQ